MNTSLIECAKRGDTKRLKALLDIGKDCNKKDPYGRTPLHWAAQDGFLGVVRLLIPAGASINAKDRLGFTPLVVAAGEGHDAVVRVLLRAGASPNFAVSGNSRGTALHLACAWNRYNVVKTLIELSSVDINARDGNRMTPLGHAVDGDFKKLVNYLIKRGAMM